jgi:hypothetical protein
LSPSFFVSFCFNFSKFPTLMLFSYPLFTKFGYYSHVFDVYSTFIQTFGSCVEWLTQGMVVKHVLCIDCSLKMILLTFLLTMFLGC